MKSTHTFASKNGLKLIYKYTAKFTRYQQKINTELVYEARQA